MAARVSSSAAIAMGALGKYLNATMGGALGGLRNTFLVVVGGGVIAVAGAFVPRLVRLARHHFADYALFSLRHPALRKKAARLDNKGARWEQDKAHRLVSRNFGPSPCSRWH